jgi:hypothetical protein
LFRRKNDWKSGESTEKKTTHFTIKKLTKTHKQSDPNSRRNAFGTVISAGFPRPIWTLSPIPAPPAARKSCSNSAVRGLGEPGPAPFDAYGLRGHSGANFKSQMSVLSELWIDYWNYKKREKTNSFYFFAQDSQKMKKRLWKKRHQTLEMRCFYAEKAANSHFFRARAASQALFFLYIYMVLGWKTRQKHQNE